MRRAGFWIGLALLLTAAGCTAGAPRSTSAPTAGERGACVQLYVFYATWCPQCRYIKPEALRLGQEEASRVKVTLMLADSPEAQTLRDRYAVRCLPAFVVVDPGGRPLSPVRCGYIGYEGLKAMVQEAARAAGCSGS